MNRFKVDVGTMMSPLPVSLEPSSLLEEATELMDAYGVRHLPVVEGGRVVGIVGDRDLFSRTGWRPARNGAPPERFSQQHRQQTLADLMHPPTVRLAPDDPPYAAAAGIAAQRVGCVAVERGGILIGIVTEVDVLRTFAELVGTGELPAQSDPPIGDLMTREIETVTGQTTLAEAVELCRTESIHHLPVMSRRELVGMLSDRDLARAMGRDALPDTEVLELMTPAPLTLRADERTSVAAQKMSEEKIGALPVLEGGYLAGLLSTTDVLHHTRDVLGG